METGFVKSNVRRLLIINYVLRPLDKCFLVSNIQFVAVYSHA